MDPANAIFLTPGIALLILSTATRFSQFESECRLVAAGEVPCNAEHRQLLSWRAERFNHALVAAYSALALLALGAISGLLHLPSASALGGATMVLAASAVLYAVIQLVREARHSTRIVLALINAEKQ